MEDTIALLCHKSGVVKVMKHHRHEDQVRRPVCQRDSLALGTCISNAAAMRFAPGLCQHLLGRIHTDDVRLEARRKRVRKAPGPTAQIQDVEDPAPSDM
jgi:hypothetical protein